MHTTLFAPLAVFMNFGKNIIKPSTQTGWNW